MSRESDGLTTKRITELHYEVIYCYSAQIKQVDFLGGFFFVWGLLLIIIIIIIMFILKDVTVSAALFLCLIQLVYTKPNLPFL